jgi:hypothetical protein
MGKRIDLFCRVGNSKYAEMQFLNRSRGVSLFATAALVIDVLLYG